MTQAEIIERIKSRKGQFSRVVWRRPAHTRKGSPSIVKETSVIVRCGIEYDNTQGVKAGRSNGTLPAENAGLQWGEWEEYPWLIAHKGKRYVRLYPVQNSVPQVIWSMDGVVVKKSEIESYLLSKEKSNNSQTALTFTVNVEHIESFDQNQ